MWRDSRQKRLPRHRARAVGPGGGCLQCFTRRGAKFETGMHFVGSAAEGQTLSRLMRFLELDGDVKLSRLDPSGYDVVSLEGKLYKFANGRQAFVDQMAEYFPHSGPTLSGITT